MTPANPPAAGSSLDIDALAAILDDAVATATATAQLSLSHPMSLTDAYAVQARGARIRARRGDRVVGVKLGFTSKAKAEQMGVSDVIIGVLHESMRFGPADCPELSRWLHPRIEPEVAFRLGRDVDLADPEADILAAVSAVAPALEIIDSRYENFAFSLTDVVADNTSAAGFVLGDWLAYDEVAATLDLADLDVQLAVGDTTVESGSTADILGDPVDALRAAQRMARTYGLELAAGSIVFAGAATAAVALPAGSVVTATVAGLGSARFTSGAAR
ncbi:fumarylacetoacetate hydrolase family protein [Nocardia sp. R7R-8]|uniref:fumarylacetoacetate hydrolase family protein n=1 Tax=Nocardia sp. R7R-8 TaxID=3459304 RepID=UPI00403E28FE